MNAITFDTLKFARALHEKAQLTNEQAEGFAEALTDAFQGEIAMRSDVEAASSALRNDFKAEIAEAKSEIMKWMFGTIGFQTLIILGAVIA